MKLIATIPWSEIKERSCGDMYADLRAFIASYKKPKARTLVLDASPWSLLRGLIDPNTQSFVQWLIREGFLPNLYLQNANLRDENLRGAYLQFAILTHAYLGGADLAASHLTRADLRGADLNHADLNHARLNGAYLTGAILEGADLTYAITTDTDLCGVDLSQATLDCIDLCGTLYDTRTKWPEGFHPQDHGAVLVQSPTL